MLIQVDCRELAKHLSHLTKAKWNVFGNFLMCEYRKLSGPSSPSQPSFPPLIQSLERRENIKPAYSV